MTASYEPQANESFSVQQFFKNAAEVWASSPHLRSKSKLHHEIKQTSKKQSEESQLPWKAKGCNEIQGFRGNCDSQGKLGMCPSLAEPDSGGIPRRELLLEKTVFPVRQKGVPPLLLPTSMLQLPRCLVRICNLDSHDTTLFELDNFKTCNCSWKTWFQNHICFANVGCSPTPRQHFWKIAGSKNFLFLCSAQMTQPIFHPANSLYVWQAFYCFMWNNALGKQITYGSAKSLRSLPLCCSPVVALFELAMNLS